MSQARTKIDDNCCKGCNICVSICPVDVYAEGVAVSSRGYPVPVIAHPEKCMDARRGSGEKKKCELCVYVCPDQAIRWEHE